jgi:hypothetical protein
MNQKRNRFRGSRGRPAGLPDRPLTNRPRRSRQFLFPLFYHVDIRHRQLLQSQLHPLTGADAQERTIRKWKLHGCLFVKLPPRAIGNRQTAGVLFVALRNKYTPTNLFRLNQNIKPMNSASGYDP